MMGLWYGSEILMHSQDNPGVYEYDTCVIIHLTDVTQQVSLGLPLSLSLYLSLIYIILYLNVKFACLGSQ